MLVLVTDGEDRAALAACRGLARAGHTVAVAAGVRGAATHASRACSLRLHVPRSLSADEFVAGLADAAQHLPLDTILPASDAALLAISRLRERLPQSLLSWLPSADVVSRTLQKAALVEAAAAIGLPVLETKQCGAPDDAYEAAAAFGFPVVVKPRMSVVSSRREAARVVANETELEAALGRLGEPVLIQRYHARADVLSLAGVAWNRRLVAVAAAKWSRRWPPVDGAASFAETVLPPASLVDRAEGLVGALGWDGLFELEFLQLDTETFAPLDFNPRPFGWMALALHAGANLPAVWADCVRGLKQRHVAARAGVRYRWEDGDLKHLLWQLRRGHVIAAAAALAPRRRVAHAYFELRDPRPLAAAFGQLARSRITTRE